MEEIGKRIGEFWASLKPLGKAVFLIGLGLLVVMAFYLPKSLIGAAPGEVEVLYTDLDSKDAGAIAKELKKKGVSYRLAEGGRTILVPRDRAPELRLELASEGLPARGVVGYEVFEQARLGITGPELEAMRIRAIEGELTRTIRQLEQVVDASVNVTIPPESAFLGRESASTAAVQLTLRPNASLGPNQVNALVHLIEHSVPYLTPENITITDQYSNLLWPRDSEGGAVATNEQIKLKRQVELYYQQKLKGLLEPIFGQGNVSAQVEVVMDFDKKSRESETFAPVVGTEGIPKKLESTRQRGLGEAQPTGGVPGTTTNIPGYQEPQPTGGQEALGTESESTKIEYEVNREVSRIEEALGKIVSKSVSVVVNTEEWDDNKAQVVRDLVASAVGFNPEGGDQITVVGQPFKVQPSPIISAQVAAERRARTFETVTRISLWVALLLALAGVVAMFLARLRTAARVVTAAVPGGKIDVIIGKDIPEEEYILREVPEEEETKVGKLRSEIGRLILERPEDIVSVLRSWLFED